MSDEESQVERVRYHYERVPEVQPRTAHGVWGGVNPQGEIELNFYTESDDLPPYTEQNVLPDGSPGLERIPASGNLRHVTRNIHSRVLLNYHTAKAVLGWLEERIKELEEEEGPDFHEIKNGIKQ